MENLTHFCADQIFAFLELHDRQNESEKLIKLIVLQQFDEVLKSTVLVANLADQSLCAHICCLVGSRSRFVYEPGALDLRALIVEKGLQQLL